MKNARVVYFSVSEDIYLLKFTYKINVFDLPGDKFCVSYTSTMTLEQILHDFELSEAEFKKMIFLKNISLLYLGPDVFFNGHHMKFIKDSEINTLKETDSEFIIQAADQAKDFFLLRYTKHCTNYLCKVVSHRDLVNHFHMNTVLNYN